MSDEDELREEAKEMFTVSQEEALSDALEEMEGWFYISDGEITLDETIYSLDKGRQYLTYVLATYVAEFIGERNSKAVEHSEVNDYFGWDTSQRDARDCASDYSDFLNSENGAKSIAPAKLKAAVDKVAEKLESG